LNPGDCDVKCVDGSAPTTCPGGLACGACTP
jgi:hypothetical protein